MALVQAWLAVESKTRPSLLPAADWIVVATRPYVCCYSSDFLCPFLRSIDMSGLCSLFFWPTIRVWTCRRHRRRLGLLFRSPLFQVLSFSSLFIQGNCHGAVLHIDFIFELMFQSSCSWTTSLKPVGLGPSCKNPSCCNVSPKGNLGKAIPHELAVDVNNSCLNSSIY